MAGVYLIADSNFNNISGNKILNNSDGVYFTNAGDCGFFEGNSNNTLTGNEISNNIIGIYSQNSKSTINSNIVCNNTNFDFNSPDWLTSSGDNNTCGTVSGWKDNGIENSCTFRCNGTKCDYDGDYYVTPMCGGTDCDDTNSSINPIAEETYYNGVDDDCNLSTNDCDQDGDGFNATFNVSLGICNGNDCNDSNSNIHPGATEFCNKIDDNCNDIVDDNPVCLCDLNNDGLIIRDYNDLMTAYRCFLGVQKDCEISYLNWSAVQNEYNCFAGNF
jgi:parallel beta-helix repeat protein